MQDRSADKSTASALDTHMLKLMSPEQFAALGVESMVFTRWIDGTTLVRLLPDARIGIDDGPFILVMSADGNPVLVTDNEDSLEAWLEEQPVVLATVH
jgi:hypothetical protein